MPRLPSTDLYFRNALGHLLARWWRPCGQGRVPILPISANCFAIGQWLVLIRRDSDEIMRKALDWPGPLAYVIDDDIAGAASSPSLPADYRQRLAQFDAAWHRPLLARAQAVVVPADALAGLLGADPAISAPIQRIEPCWHLPLADQSHFAALAHGAPLRIAHLGTASHSGGLQAIAPALGKLLADNPKLRFTYVAPAPLPDLPRHNSQHIAPQSWPRYRRWLAGQRFHLALYPLTGERFDRARSASKLTEHAIVGAAGLYPQDWAPAKALGTGALLAPAEPANWGEAITQAITSPTLLAQTAATAAAALTCQDAAAVQQELWARILGIDST